MLNMEDATGRGEPDVLLTPRLDRELESLGFRRVGVLAAKPPKPAQEQMVAVWVSPESDAFAIPEANPRGPERFCYFRTLLLDGSLVDSSDEPTSLAGFFGGRTRKSIPGAGYRVTHHPGLPLADVWAAHQRQLAEHASSSRVHGSMDEVVALSRFGVTLLARVLRLGGAFMALVLLGLAVGLGVWNTWFGTIGPQRPGPAIALFALVASSQFLGMRLARLLPRRFWPPPP
ncbi:MAG: hypothetical protein KDA24_30305 [Deltaproteobacteria bacterium]|nr:hypothetical protein [Deltaproteobacteria bacterium]